uniref:beta-glucosidase n=1 Tax=Alexandrium catenella TaxID=2925 RepID=A0A7S1RXW2_ALECA
MTCPGNSVNGQAACGSQRLLSEDLRGKMGFKGFVLSDWGATTSPAGMAMGGVKMVSNGLDLEMPVEALLSKTGLFFADKKGAGGTQTAFDQGVMHMLSAVFKMGLDSEEGCAGPHKCYEALLTNVTSSQHVSLARTVATEAVTLLKNDGVLPLDPSRVKKIAVVGPAAVQVQDVSAAAYQNADYYSAGGAEHCRTGAVVTPLAALSRYAAQRGIEVESTGTSDPMDMLYTIHSADVVIVVAAATSTADGPRSSMNLDSEMDKLISQVAKSKTTVVLMQTPGAVLTPWRDEVSAIANLFLAGQETGSAWAAVVFGEAEPAGRLPVAFPAEQRGLLVGADPSFVRYDEGLFTSYRAGTQQAAFPFGHGLSYTNFSYGIPELRADCGAKVCVSMRVKNTGARSGREVAQAYLDFPSAAAMPRKLLRGFKKTKMLRPQESEELVFAFTERDLSTYSNGAWLAWDGVAARFGASSEDFRQELTLSQPGAAQMAAAPAEETKAQASGPAAPRGQLEVSKAPIAEPATLRAVIPEKPKVPRRFAPPPTPPRRESRADEASTIQQPLLRRAPVARHA